MGKETRFGEAPKRTREGARAPIPKPSNKTHVRENAQSAEIKLTEEDFSEIDRGFPPPKSKEPLCRSRRDGRRRIAWSQQPAPDITELRAAAKEHGFVEFSPQDFQNMHSALFAGDA